MGGLGCPLRCSSYAANTGVMGQNDVPSHRLVSRRGAKAGRDRPLPSTAAVVILAVLAVHVAGRPATNPGGLRHSVSCPGAFKNPVPPITDVSPFVGLPLARALLRCWDCLHLSRVSQGRLTQDSLILAPRARRYGALGGTKFSRCENALDFAPWRAAGSTWWSRGRPRLTDVPSLDGDPRGRRGTDPAPRSAEPGGLSDSLTIGSTAGGAPGWLPGVVDAHVHTSAIRLSLTRQPPTAAGGGRR